MKDILFAVFYLVAIVVLILHFTGWLDDRNMNWLVYVVDWVRFDLIYPFE